MPRPSYDITRVSVLHLPCQYDVMAACDVFGPPAAISAAPTRLELHMKRVEVVKLITKTLKSPINSLKRAVTGKSIAEYPCDIQG